MVKILIVYDDTQMGGGMMGGGGPGGMGFDASAAYTQEKDLLALVKPAHAMGELAERYSTI